MEPPLRILVYVISCVLLLGLDQRLVRLFDGRRGCDWLCRVIFFNDDFFASIENLTICCHGFKYEFKVVGYSYTINIGIIIVSRVCVTINDVRFRGRRNLPRPRQGSPRRGA